MSFVIWVSLVIVAVRSWVAEVTTKQSMKENDMHDIVIWFSGLAAGMWLGLIMEELWGRKKGGE